MSLVTKGSNYVKRVAAILHRLDIVETKCDFWIAKELIIRTRENAYAVEVVKNELTKTSNIHRCLLKVRDYVKHKKHQISRFCIFNT